MDAYRSQRRRGGDPLEQGFDRLISAGRQLVDGVSGTRPGTRASVRGAAATALPRLGDLGRWVESRLDGLLDEDDDSWREPWQEQRPSARITEQRSLTAPPATGRRRPLEAISRRGLLPPAVSDTGSDTASDTATADAWPDDDSFSLPRWQRDPLTRRSPQPEPPRAAPPGRPLPRSSRRR